MIMLNDENFKQETSQGLVIVDFWASWCPPCRMFLPVFEKVASEMKDVKLAKCNVEENQRTPAEFGIRSIPAILAFKDGVLIDTRTGAMSENTLKEWINGLK